jgi:hypothetical protein
VRRYVNELSTRRNVFVAVSPITLRNSRSPRLARLLRIPPKLGGLRFYATDLTASKPNIERVT